MPIEIVIEHVFRSLIAGATFVILAFSPVGRAFAQRILNGGRGAVPLADPRVDDLVEENEMLRRQMDEVHERLEFTERMLAQARERGALGSAKT